jgi:hypothetical protein
MPARRAKRMLSFPFASTRTTRTADFADEIKFIIFSFSHGDNIISSWSANGKGNRNDNTEGPVSKKITLYGYLSKNWYASCIRYVQQRPMMVRQVEVVGSICSPSVIDFIAESNSSYLMWNYPFG